MICCMKKMGIIYGSSTGTCESIAQTIAEKLGVASVDVIDASKITTEKVESYDILLLGTSTWETVNCKMIGMTPLK